MIRPKHAVVFILPFLQFSGFRRMKVRGSSSSPCALSGGFGLEPQLGASGFRVYWGYISVMDKKMETIGIIGIIWGFIGDNGKEHGN